MIELHELRFTKTDLARAPERDRLFYLMATGLANDLQTLLKLFAAAVGEEEDDPVLAHGGSTVGMLMLRLLAGRMWEGWKLVESGYKKIEDHYREQLNHDAREALVELRSFFAARRNLISTVRDKIGFHADPGIVKRAWEHLPDDMEMSEYFSGSVGNTLYFAAELLHYEAIRGFTGLVDQPDSLRILTRAAPRLVGHFTIFIFGFSGVFIQRYLADQVKKLGRHPIRLEGCPNFRDLKLPYFTEN
jgi:hypothetical protein